MMTATQDFSERDVSESAAASSKRVTVPILVGITGKRRKRLAELGISEAQVRAKLCRAFDLLETLTPNSPKLLLCGMADGVDEIAAKLEKLQASRDSDLGRDAVRAVESRWRASRFPPSTRPTAGWARS